MIERGRLERVSIKLLRRVAQALDAELAILVRWRGGDLDRLLDEDHARLIGQVILILKAAGWHLRTEVTYAWYGERGSIDILAWHPGMRTILVIEVKTDLVSVEETIRRHDEKSRLAARVARDQFGWHAARVARILVLPEHSTARRRVERHAAVLAAAYPARGTALRRWLREPTSDLSGLLFLSADRTGARSSVRKRVRCTKVA